MAVFKRFIQCWLLVPAILVSQVVFAAQYVSGDLAPWGDPDGQINAADLLILTHMVHGLKTPTPLEEIVGDVAPLNSPDGVLRIRTACNI